VPCDGKNEESFDPTMGYDETFATSENSLLNGEVSERLHDDIDPPTMDSLDNSDPGERSEETTYDDERLSGDAETSSPSSRKLAGDPETTVETTLSDPTFRARRATAVVRVVKKRVVVYLKQTRFLIIYELEASPI
jgi:hypothetical protein